MERGRGFFNYSMRERVGYKRGGRAGGKGKGYKGEGDSRGEGKSVTLSPEYGKTMPVSPSVTPTNWRHLV